MKIGNVVWNLEEHAVSCGICGSRLASDNENWKEHSLVRRTNAGERLNSGCFGQTYQVYDHPDLDLAEIFCPFCKSLLTVELYLRNEPLRWSYRSLRLAAEAGYDAVEEYNANPGDWISFGVSR
jgi:acetone carboxylase gamma subunit